MLVLGGKAYKNLRRKGGGKYRKVYWLWVAKPERNCDRKVLNGRPPPFRDPPGPSWAKVAHFIPVKDRGGTPFCVVFRRGKWVAFAVGKLLFFVSIPPWTHMRSQKGGQISFTEKSIAGTCDAGLDTSVDPHEEPKRGWAREIGCY